MGYSPCSRRHEKDSVYLTSVRVAVGSPVRIPEPVGFTLDTSVFEKALGRP
ncbi:hypothetical protein ACFV0L_06325 [Streptosporangium canum]|uniref:hypothetical protein n=1 Tax=Streptosporangium canum TaxID=324952 RepID=UPI00367B6D67